MKCLKTSTNLKITPDVVLILSQQHDHFMLGLRPSALFKCTQSNANNKN